MRTAKAYAEPAMITDVGLYLRTAYLSQDLERLGWQEDGVDLYILEGLEEYERPIAAALLAETIKYVVIPADVDRIIPWFGAPYLAVLLRSHRRLNHSCKHPGPGITCPEFSQLELTMLHMTDRNLIILSNDGKSTILAFSVELLTYMLDTMEKFFVDTTKKARPAPL